MKTKLNKEERSAIVRKIQRAYAEKRTKEITRLNDEYKPSDTYMELEAAFKSIAEGIKRCKELKYSFYLGNSDYVDVEKFVTNELASIKEKELAPTYPPFKLCETSEIEDELILETIDPDWSVEKIIEKYIKKYC